MSDKNTAICSFLSF